MELAKTYPVAVVCRVLEVPRSSFYTYQAQQARVPNPEDQRLKAKLEALAALWPCYGYRRMTDAARRPPSRSKTRPSLDGRRGPFGPKT